MRLTTTTLLLAAACGLASPSAGAQSADQAMAAAMPTARPLFWDDYRRGWHFYEDPEPEAAPPAPVAAPRAATVPNRSLPQPQAQPKFGMNGNAAQAPASSGWKFPFRKSSVNGVAENGANGAVPIVVE